MCYSVPCTNTQVRPRRTNSYVMEASVMSEAAVEQPNEINLVLVDSSVLPDTFNKVIYAKKLLQTGKAQSASDACQKAGLSRSAFYKYKEHVFDYDDTAGRIVTIYAELADRAGILSKLISVLYECGANIMTVNQNIPSGGSAAVSVSFRTGQLKMSVSQTLSSLKKLDGVRLIRQVSGE